MVQRKICLFSGVILLLLVSASVAPAATLHVPGEYATIQAGIDAAVDGDTVLVADGTYTGEGNKNIDFGGKAITLQSENGAESCIIDCEGDGRGFSFDSSETERSVLSGFTITNGYVEGYEEGGGIHCWDSSPTIADCIISDNTAEDGGGIYCDDASIPSITNTIIWKNTPDTIYLDDDDSNPIVTHSDIQGGWEGEGNIDADPLFVGDGDYHLTDESPCIDAGSDDVDNLPATRESAAYVWTWGPMNVMNA